MQARTSPGAPVSCPAPMNYHVARNGQQLGIYPKDDAAARYQRGEILPTDLVWAEGMPGWVPASTVFAPNPVPPPPPPPPSTGPDVRTPGPVPFDTGAAALARPPKPDNFLVWSILATVFCCLIGGIIAIVYSTQVDSKYAAGDYAGAADAAKTAKLWTMISAGVGVLIALVYVVFMAIGFAGAMSGMH